MLKFKGSDAYEALILRADASLRPNVFAEYAYGVKLDEHVFLDLITAKIYPIVKDLNILQPEGEECACKLMPLSNIRKNKHYTYGEIAKIVGEAQYQSQLKFESHKTDYLAEEIRRVLNQ